MEDNVAAFKACDKYANKIYSQKFFYRGPFGAIKDVVISESYNFKGVDASDGKIDYSNTHPGYVKLINDEVDLIVVTQPSKEELELAKEKNVELEVIPVVKEGFVFYVNANNEVIDKETLYLLHDGVPAVRYYLQLNRDVVQYDDSGKATDTTPIRCDLIKIDGTTYEQLIECPPFFDLKYSVDGSALKEYTPGTEIVYNGFSDNLDFYFYHADADGTVLLDHDTVIVMKTPRGEKGRIIYPAGTYDNTKIYETTPEMAPYVFDPMDKNFYLLDKETVWVGETQNNQTPSENWRNGENADYVWKNKQVLTQGGM